MPVSIKQASTKVSITDFEQLQNAINEALKTKQSVMTAVDAKVARVKKQKQEYERTAQDPEQLKQQIAEAQREERQKSLEAAAALRDKEERAAAKGRKAEEARIRAMRERTLSGFAKQYFEERIESRYTESLTRVLGEPESHAFIEVITDSDVEPGVLDVLRVPKKGLASKSCKTQVRR